MIFNYTKYGDSPACLGEEKNLENKSAVIQGFGLEPSKDEAGTLLEIPLRIISNAECYEKFQESFKSQPARKSPIRTSLYDGLSDQVMCTITTCDLSDLSTKEDKSAKCVSIQYSNLKLGTIHTLRRQEGWVGLTR